MKRGNAGALRGWLDAVIRIRRRAAGRSSETEELGRLALDALRSGVVVLDGDNQVLLANRSARDLGVLGPGQPGELDATLLAAVGWVRRTGQCRVVELDLPRAAGSGGGIPDPAGVNVRTVPLADGYVAIEATDVTEAHRLSRVRRDFVANVSHELKTPIGGLRLLSEALIEAAREPDGEELGAIRRFAERIKRESTRLGQLVADLLELARIQGAEPLARVTQVALDGVIADVLDRTALPAAAKGITVEIEGTRGLVACAVADQCRTALANLVENAIAYSCDQTRVILTTRADGEAVEIAVSDQGIGIDPHDLGRIFERFYRADKARSRATGGTGLGLAIVKHIATNHGGRVDVVSETGKGSTFTLRLPAGRENAADR